VKAFSECKDESINRKDESVKLKDVSIKLKDVRDGYIENPHSHTH